MIDLSAIGDAIFQAAVEALGEGGMTVERSAKKHAPIRSIFSRKFVGSYKIRYKSARAVRAEAAVRDLALRTETTLNAGPYTVVHPGNVGRNKSSRQVWLKSAQRRVRPSDLMELRGIKAAERQLREYKNDRFLSLMGYNVQKSHLSARGAYEVKTKRAMFSVNGQNQIGGRLRGEIYTTSPAVSGYRSEVWVISPTPYAKYQEFGTRHNAAHPFLRPAAAESRRSVVGRVASAVKSASRTSAGKAGIEIVVHI